jgi:ketosteroid isomerase-like protein
MSQENVEIVRSAFERWNATREPDFSHFHPELVYHPRADEPDPSAHIGRDEYERLFRGFVESFSEMRVEVLDLIDVGDRVIASTVLHGTIGGGDLKDAYVFVYELRDGLIMEGWEYKTRQEALEAVGLSEPPSR